ncbi:MAG: ComEC/Rec2 family competence protein [Bacteroidales bacterium]
MARSAEDIRKIPMVRILFPWATGIAVGLKNLWLTGCTGIILLLTLFAALSAGFILAKKNYRLRYIFGILAMVFIFVAGWFYSSQKAARVGNILSKKEEGVYIAEIVEPGKTSHGQPTGVCRIMYKIDDTILYPAHFRLLVYFPDESDMNAVKPGNRFCFSGQLRTPSAPKNPEEFDYGRYLLLRGISGYVRIRSTDIIWFPSGKTTLRSLAWQTRETLLGILSRYRIPEKERGVLAALSLGYRDDLTEETMRAYRSAGVMHILAVSGLHVGIIYLLFQYITFFLQRKKWERITRSLLGLVILWGYAFLTGLSPSVVRAATMFSFYTASGLLNRKVSSFNILASAVFVILAADPFLIAQPGFQLSAAAVASITAFYSKVESLWIPGNPVARKIWSLIAVTLAAQAGTFLLCIYYFHQFPVYFVLANLVAVPMAGLLLYGIVILYLFAWWPFAASLLSSLLTFLTSLLNQSTRFIESLPGAVITGLWIEPVQLALLGTTLLLLAIFLYYKKAYLLQLALLGLIGSLLISAGRKWQNSRKELVAIYDLPNYSVISIRTGNCRIILCDSLAEKRSEYIFDKTENFRIRENAEPSVLVGLDKTWPEDQRQSVFSLRLSDGCRLIALPDKNIVISAKTNIPTRRHVFKANLLVITGRKFQSPSALLAAYEPDFIVTDASVPDWCNKRYAEFFQRIHVPFYPVAWNGAFVMEK